MTGPAVISFGKDVCSDLAQASSREWLETNGLGGFACSTLAGMNTRRYHGLLTAAMLPPVGRVLLLSKLEETLLIGQQKFDLATNGYCGAVHPEGYRYLSAFRLDPFPVSTFELEGFVLEKSIFMVQGSNTTVVIWKLLQAPAGSSAELEVRPLIAFRDYHSTAHENSTLNPDFEQEPNQVCVTPYLQMPTLYLAHSTAAVEKQGYWYRNFCCERERERGLDCVEDLFNPLVMRFALRAGEEAAVIASTDSHDCGSVTRLRQQELKRRKAIRDQAAVKDDFVQTLTFAASQFLVKRGEGETVIAGYPWFTDWGRDTMISLPGLTLATGRAETAKRILREFARHVDQGMLPNRFPDRGETAEFNTVDATLWFFEAARAYFEATHDFSFIAEELYGVFVEIVQWHMHGTRYNIHTLENGLLFAGAPGVQLTWMDAKIGDWVVTPRTGLPVEIQALWYNAIKIMEAFAVLCEDEGGRQLYESIANQTRSSFNSLFWNEGAHCLYDVVADSPDPAIRPNQIFAVSLPYSMLPPERAGAVLQIVERELLTPVGLRSLGPRDPSYKGRYGGDQRSRDSAYHQGTVWPWLLGPFIRAYVRVHGNTPATREQARRFLAPLEAHLRQAGLGQISEVFDGDAPHQPGGCFAQAWSVAEILRSLCEVVYETVPVATPPQKPSSRSATRPASTAASN